MIIGGATIAAEFPGKVIEAVRLVFVSRGMTAQSRWFVLIAETSVPFFIVVKASWLAILMPISPSVLTRVDNEVFHQEK